MKEKILNYLGLNSRNTAQIAKERLRVTLEHERLERRSDGINLHELHQKLIDVITAHLGVDRNKVEINIELDEDKNKNRSVLELNVTLPEKA